MSQFQASYLTAISKSSGAARGSLKGRGGKKTATKSRRFGNSDPPPSRELDVYLASSVEDWEV